LKLADLGLAVFDSSIRQNFYPFSLTRPCFELCLGTRTLLERIESNLSTSATHLFVPKYLEPLAKENHPSARVNEEVSQRTLYVNSLLTENPKFQKFLEENISQKEEVAYVDSDGTPIFTVLESGSSRLVDREFIGSRIKRKKIPVDLDSLTLHKVPWQLVERNSEAISLDFARLSSLGQLPGSDREIIGNSFSIKQSASIGKFVTMDSRKGPIIIEDDVQVDSFSHIAGPCFIGKGTVIKSARIREGTSIQSSCRISGEIEQSIFNDYTNKSHEGFVGHSIVGSWVNMGALTTTSDLKNTYGEVKVRIGSRLMGTSSIKVGVFVGDMVKTGIGVMLSSGKTVGASSHVLANVYDNVPSFTLHGSGKKSDVEMYLDSAIETQKRMMSRRNKTLSDAYVSMMQAVFKMTRSERQVMKVSRGKFSL
jgi:UDP-N-acetylglucosamine diphosphorylase / glucose-1-phosphate thymidylyltransferase / UDP-N-acetylgalactosamine diphosphorylase / glucosamine-1-phosphate N-acetyltransferase / galactosamine-1-phosphate N-acetyltransferase